MPSSDRQVASLSLRDKLGPARDGARLFSDRDTGFDPSALIAGSSFAGRIGDLVGRSVLIAPRGQVAAALAMIELDGIARRMVICPPDLKAENLPAILEDAGIEAIVCDTSDDFAATGLIRVPCGLPIVAQAPPPRLFETEWVLLTSGTTGRPKMVIHTLAGLTGAIKPSTAATPVWATFYDIRRYGGLQIFFRAVLGGASLILTSEGETVADHLARLGAGGVTHMSGTPSHWRRVLMSQAVDAMAPAYVRLSGEIADQAVLDALHASYPRAAIGHAYASTEAGVGFDVDDGREGFPVAFTERGGGDVTMRVVDGALRIRSNRIASRYVANMAPLADEDGFVDTGDMLERRGDRYYFVGRRGGIVNVGGLKVHPEEVEAALNCHPMVRMSLVTARKNPFTGSIVVADIVLIAGVGDPGEALKAEIIEACRLKLDRHKVPVSIRFVPALDITPSGKVRRAHA